MACSFRRLRQSLLFKTFSYLLFIYGYCEYVIYYVTQIQCGFPTLSKVPSVRPVHVMILADPHLLGPRSHWLDKWRREWQMHRAFQTAMVLHKPEIVFVLGDLFDEGDKCSENEFNEYVRRFHHLFRVPEGTSLYVVAGNHDIGYHYKITPTLSRRWERRMGAPPVRLLSVRGVHFVLLNSMALQGDGCELCARAEAQIHHIADVLKCSSGSKLCKGKTKLEKYSRPILIQHFPLYRASDSQCTEPDAAPLPERDSLFVERWDCLSEESTDSLVSVIILQHFPLYRASDNQCTEPDAAPLPERDSLFVERWDCLSEESTDSLVERLRPRLALGAHTHHSCALRHSFGTEHDKIEFTEYTVPSFSWRNRLDPKYYLATITPEEAQISKCELPREWTLQATAVLMLTALLLYLRFSNTRQNLTYKHLSGKKV